MNRLIFFISFVLWINAEQLYHNDKLIRLTPIHYGHMNYLLSLEANSTLDFWTDVIAPDKPIDIHITAMEYEKYVSQFKQYSLPYKVLIDDLQKIIDDEKQQIEEDHLMRYIQSRWSGRIKADIVGTYASYDDMIGYLQEKANADPNSIQVFDLGQTYQGRAMKGIELAFNPSATRNIWIDCGIHARGNNKELKFILLIYFFFLLSLKIIRMDNTSDMYLVSG
jgi:hypothetical protein